MVNKLIYIIIFVAYSSVTHANQIIKPKEIQWSFDGIKGKFDIAAIQRGFEVYKQVCASCHSISGLAYRNLLDIGFTQEQVKFIAAEHSVIDGPGEDGEMFERPATPSDRFAAPYKNEKAARYANNGRYPPDLTLMVKARHDGANYVYSLLSSFNQTPPADKAIPDGTYYNPYFPGGFIGMAPPLLEDIVTYKDGTKATIEQMSKDVVNFLQWASEPEMEHRKKMGIRAVIYLVLMTSLFYILYKKIWKRLD